MNRIPFLSAGIGVAALGVALTGPLASAQTAPNGETLFRQRCAMCHSAVSTRQVPLGPNLARVVGRKAGTAAFAYSPQLKASGLVWNRANLDRFLTAPARLVPGTKMVIAVPSSADRAALLNYLTTTR